jgi:ferric-dicitrate binding protein FerR (iron transport regulator)
MSLPDSRAAELIEQHLAGGLDPAGAAKLRQALREQPALARQLYEAARMHRCLQTALGPVASSGPAPARVPTRFRRRFLIPALAAAAAALVLGLLLWHPAAAQPIGQTQGPGLFVTRDQRERALAAGDALFAGDRLRAGSRADLALVDGSTVRLDAGTVLTLARLEPEERAGLELATGRIFLRVTQAPGRFRVAAGAATVEVLGTVFGVTRTDGGALASVYEGRVRVGTGAGALELGRGEAARADAGAAPVLTADSPAELLAWARDWTRFEDRPLGEVLDWIAANSPYRFTASAAVRARLVSIAIADEPLSRPLETLLIACNLARTNRDHDVVITGETP